MLLENDLRHMVNGMDGFRAGSVVGSSYQPCVIECYNQQIVTTIKAFQAVCASSGPDYIAGFIPVNPDTSGTFVWGVALEPIAPHGVGRVMVSGCCRVTLSATGSGDFALPDVDGKFKRGSTGARILFASGTDATIQIGGASGIASEYEGEFKVVNNGDGTISVIDGSGRYGDGICGQTDIGPYARIPVTTLTLPEDPNNWALYLNASWSDNAYHFNFDFSYPSETGTGWVQVAWCAHGNIYQLHKGGIISYGTRYLV